MSIGMEVPGKIIGAVTRAVGLSLDIAANADFLGSHIGDRGRKGPLQFAGNLVMDLISPMIPNRCHQHGPYSVSFRRFRRR